MAAACGAHACDPSTEEAGPENLGKTNLASTVGIHVSEKKNLK